MNSKRWEVIQVDTEMVQQRDLVVLTVNHAKCMEGSALSLEILSSMQDV